MKKQYINPSIEMEIVEVTDVVLSSNLGETVGDTNTGGYNISNFPF